jgi:hypothetical protein
MEMKFFERIFGRSATEEEIEPLKVFEPDMDSHFIETMSLNSLPGASYIGILLGGPRHGTEVECLIGQTVLFVAYKPTTDHPGVRVLRDGSAVSIYVADVQGKWNWIGNLELRQIIELERILTNEQSLV